MTEKFMRGALVEFMPTFLIPVPNVIVFQFNPEQMVHSWTPASPDSSVSDSRARDGKNHLAVSGMPSESFSFNIHMDARDMISQGSAVAQGIATVSGIYSRLAALEMLLYPTSVDGSGELLGTASAVISSALSGGSSSPKVTTQQLPTVLFVWGPERIVPVRLSSLRITETLFDALLNPIHAQADMELKVLTSDELKSVNGPLATVAQVAYKYTHPLREAFAVANLGNAVESIIGMLPI